MSVPLTIADAIQKAALEGKQSIAAGGTSVSQMSIAEQIAAARFLAGEQAKTTKTPGCRVSRSYGNRGGL